MRSGKERDRRAVLGAGAILGLFGALLHFAGCGLSTAGTAEQPAGTLCNTSQDCDDKNACTDDECSDQKFCSNTPKTGGGPDDANDCTTDTCTAGVESHAAEADGTSCKAGVGTGICTKSSCIVTCSTNAVCDDKNACTTDTCDQGSKTCLHGKLNGPDPGASSMPGDCKQDLCVAGVPKVVNDDTDLPALMSDCQAAACANGVGTVSNLPAETACGKPGATATKCDGKGKCAGCASAMDCTVPNTCQIAACTGGSCNPKFASAGTEPGDQQMPHDCTKIVCDGSGSANPQPDPTDPPTDDGNPCTTEGCTNDVPIHDPLPNIGKPCPTGVCNTDGSCVQCISDASCPGAKCSPQFQCVQCVSAADCNDGIACTADACANQKCVHAPMDALCDDGNVCTNDSCSAASDCQHGPNTNPCATDNNACTDDVCGGGSCQHNPNTNACATDNNVCTDDVCGSGMCQHNPNSAACPGDGNPCTTDACSGGSCMHPAVSDGTSCGAGGICVGSTLTMPFVCMSGSCKAGGSGACPDGYPCLNGTSCGSCSDGVKNGGETDKDCGGGAPCGKCNTGSLCGGNNDCKSNNCSGGPPKTCQ